MSSTPPPLDPEQIKQDLVRQTVEADLATLPIAAADAPLRFTERLLSYLREWIAEKSAARWAREDAAVFVFSEYPQLEAERCGGFEAVPLFEDSLDRPLPGHVHLCTTGVVEVHRCALGRSSSEAAREYLVKHKWDGRPTLVFYPARRLARFFPAGLRHESRSMEYKLEPAGVAVTVEEVEAALERFYDVYVRIPNPTLRVWDNPSTHIPVEDAEKVIQEGLASLLRARLSTDCLISPEWSVDLTGARADIGILPMGNQVGDWTVIEVKVLRSRWHSGNSCSLLVNETAVADGIDQAIEYRQRTAAHHAYLCCYDLRKEDDDAVCAGLRPKAAAENVVLKRYYVHNSSKVARRNRPGSAYGVLRRTYELRKRKAKK